MKIVKPNVFLFSVFKICENKNIANQALSFQVFYFVRDCRCLLPYWVLGKHRWRSYQQLEECWHILLILYTLQCLKFFYFFKEQKNNATRYFVTHSITRIIFFCCVFCDVGFIDTNDDGLPNWWTTHFHVHFVLRRLLWTLRSL